MEFTEKISVVMPTFNTPIPYLKEAINSILNQTFQDFEFIIIDDCSTNGSEEFLSDLQDKRVKVIRNSHNLGVPKSLNIGLSLAKGKYIARMDADDISVKYRFQKQYDYMKRNPDVLCLGAGIVNFEQKKILNYYVPNLKDQQILRIKYLFNYVGPIHPTLFINNEILKKHNICYDSDMENAEDYALYIQISRHPEWGKIESLNEVLLYKRSSKEQVSHTRIAKDKFEESQKSLLKELLDEASEEDYKTHCFYSSIQSSAVIDQESFNYYNQLIKLNNQLLIYDKKKFKKVINEDIKPKLLLNTIRNKKGLVHKIKIFRYTSLTSLINCVIKLAMTRFRYMKAIRQLKRSSDYNYFLETRAF